MMKNTLQAQIYAGIALIEPLVWGNVAGKVSPPPTDKPSSTKQPAKQANNAIKSQYGPAK
jgi:hypothetical protein